MSRSSFGVNGSCSFKHTSCCLVIFHSARKVASSVSSWGNGEMVCFARFR